MTSKKQGKLVVFTIEEIQRQLSKASTELMGAKTELTVKTCIEKISNVITHLEEYPKLGDETHALYETVPTIIQSLTLFVLMPAFFIKSDAFSIVEIMLI